MPSLLYLSLLGIGAAKGAAEIRTRAERKTGQLLKKRDSAQGQRTDLVAKGDQVKELLAQIGISKEQTSKWQIATCSVYAASSMLKTGSRG